MEYLVFNGESSMDFHVGIKGSGVFNSPKRKVDTVSVDGRNGALTIDRGYYENVTVKYPCYIVRDFERNMADFSAFLLSQVGYKRLEDTLHPDEYRMAMVSKELDIDVKGKAKAGVFDLTFSCKPQRYLKSGEETLSFTNSATILNETRYPSRPLIRLYGTGTLTVNGNTLSVDALYPKSYIDIDCDLMDAYWQTTNYNNYISGTFPELVPGENTISYSGNFDIIPRWWTL